MGFISQNKLTVGLWGFEPRTNGDITRFYPANSPFFKSNYICFNKIRIRIGERNAEQIVNNFLSLVIE